jgi:hypothetical protein
VTLPCDFYFVSSLETSRLAGGVYLPSFVPCTTILTTHAILSVSKFFAVHENPSFLSRKGSVHEFSRLTLSGHDAGLPEHGQGHAGGGEVLASSKGGHCIGQNPSGGMWIPAEHPHSAAGILLVAGLALWWMPRRVVVAPCGDTP